MNDPLLRQGRRALPPPVPGAALFAIASTCPYLAYYLISDAGYYRPIILANLGFLIVHAVALWLNRARHFDAARNVGLGGIFAQIVVVTSLISTGAGVHLFYFTLATVWGMVLIKRSELVMLGLLAPTVGLFLVCVFAFAPGNTALDVPGPDRDVTYVFRATGAIAAAGVFPYIFRLEIDRAYAALEDSNRDLERLSALDPGTPVGQCSEGETGRAGANPSRCCRPLASENEASVGRDRPGRR